MTTLRAAFARQFVPVLLAGVVLSLSATAGFADERCAQLIALRKQYAGVRLTSEQKALKAQLVSWYHENCGRGRMLAKR